MTSCSSIFRFIAKAFMVRVNSNLDIADIESMYNLNCYASEMLQVLTTHIQAFIYDIHMTCIKSCQSYKFGHLKGFFLLISLIEIQLR